MSRRRHSSWMGPIIELPRTGSVRIDHLRIDNVDGRTVVSAVIRAGERESSAVIYESTDASEAIQWAIDNYPQIEIRGTHNISSPITIQSNTRITGEGGELRRTSRMLEGEDEPIIRIPIRERVTGPTVYSEGPEGLHTHGIAFGIAVEDRNAPPHVHGTATIPKGASSVTVEHGLNTTPAIVIASPITHNIETSEVVCTARTATTITLTVPENVTEDRVVQWVVEAPRVEVGVTVREEPKKPEPPEDVRDARVKGLINAIGKEEKKGKKKS